MIKRIFVTGINGFIGTYLVKQLSGEGKVVCGVGKNQISCTDCYESVSADISADDFVDKTIDSISRCDAIIHLAANLDMKGSAQTILTNCVGTYNICKLANYWNIEKMIYISSIPVIGIPQNIPITEEHPVEPRTLYHITKYAGELIVKQCCNTDIGQIIIRIPSPVGVGMNGSTLLSIILEKCLLNEDIILYGKGLRKQNYVDVRDICKAISKGLSSDYSGLINIAGEQSITNYDLSKKCIDLTKAYSQIIFNSVEDKEENCIWDVSIERAKDKIGYVPRFSLDDSIRWIYDSMKREEL